MLRRVALFAALTAAACSATTPVLAPRRTPTPDHLAAKTNDACRACHDPADERNHETTDNCVSCHRLAPGR